MNRGSREKLPQKYACRAYGVHRAPGSSWRSDRVPEPAAGTAAKDSGKQKRLLKKLSKELSDLAPIRTKTREEKTNVQHPKDLTPASTRSDQDVSFPKIKVEVKGMSSKDENCEKKQSDKPMSSVDVKDESPEEETVEVKEADENPNTDLLSEEAAEDTTQIKPQISTSLEDRLRAKFTSSIQEYVTSPTFRRQLSERVIEEIGVQVAKAVTRSPEPSPSSISATAKAELPARRLREGTTKPGFSLSVTSLLCYELIETRDKMIECFQSKSEELSTSSTAEIEIVRNVFESIFASVVNVGNENLEMRSPDSTIKSFASLVFGAARESIFPRKDSQRSSQKPTDGTQTEEPGVDLEGRQASSSAVVTTEGVPEEVAAPSEEESNIQDTDANYVKSLLEGIIETSIDKPTAKSDRRSGSDGRAEKELLGESDLRAMFGLENRFQIRATFIPKKIVKKIKSLLTSKTHQQDQSPEPEVKGKDDGEGEDEDESILAAFFLAPQTSEQELEPDKEAEEHLVADSGVDLDRLTPSEEILPSEVDKDLELSEQQELASPENPLRESTCPPEPTSSSPDLHVSIPETSDTAIQKKEDDLKCTFPLSDMEKTTSLESVENMEVKEELLLTGSTAINLLTTEGPDQDQTSVLELQSKEEEKKVGSDLHHPLPPRVDSDLRESMLGEDTATSSGMSNLEEALEETATDLPEGPVPSTPWSEKPDSPRRSPGRGTCSPAKAISLPNMFLSFPDKSDTGTATTIQKEEDVLKSTLSLSEVEKTLRLKSAENQQVKEKFLTESKNTSLLLSEALEQDRSSGPDLNSKDDEDMGEDEDESDGETISIPHETSAMEPDLNLDVEAEERLVDEPDVDLGQVSSTSSEESLPRRTTEQDPRTRHWKHAIPVPSPPSPEEQASRRESPMQTPRPIQTKMRVFTEFCTSCECDCEKQDQ